MEWLRVDRRRLGAAMLVFGLAGFALAAVVGGTLVAGGLAVRDLDAQIADAESRMGASLTRLTLTMDGIAQSIDDASSTQATSRDGVARAATALGGVADTADVLAGDMGVTIAGQQPLAGAASSLLGLETRLRGIQAEATTLAGNLDLGTTGITEIARQVREMRTQFAELAGTFAGFADTRGVVSVALGGIALAGLLTAWQAVLSLAIAWAGWRLRHHSRSATLIDTAAEAPPTTIGA